MKKCLLHSVFWSVLSRPSFYSWIFNTARRTKINEKEKKWTLPLSTTRKKHCFFKAFPDNQKSIIFIYLFTYYLATIYLVPAVVFIYLGCFDVSCQV